MELSSPTYEQRLHRHYAARRARLIRPGNAVADYTPAKPADDLPRPSLDIIRTTPVTISRQMVITPSQIATMQEMYRGGASFRQIANIIGCSHTTARRYARADQ